MSFDQLAKEWDNDPKKNERAKVFANEIKLFVKGKNISSAM